MFVYIMIQFNNLAPRYSQADNQQLLASYTFWILALLLDSEHGGSWLLRAVTELIGVRDATFQKMVFFWFNFYILCLEESI
jgi:hypothetical protein